MGMVNERTHCTRTSFNNHPEWISLNVSVHSIGLNSSERPSGKKSWRTSRRPGDGINSVMWRSCSSGYTHHTTFCMEMCPTRSHYETGKWNLSLTLLYWESNEVTWSHVNESRRTTSAELRVHPSSQILIQIWIIIISSRNIKKRIKKSFSIEIIFFALSKGWKLNRGVVLFGRNINNNNAGVLSSYLNLRQWKRKLSEGFVRCYCYPK